MNFYFHFNFLFHFLKILYQIFLIFSIQNPIPSLPINNPGLSFMEISTIFPSNISPCCSSMKNTFYSSLSTYILQGIILLFYSFILSNSYLLPKGTYTNLVILLIINSFYSSKNLPKGFLKRSFKKPAIEKGTGENSPVLYIYKVTIFLTKCRKFLTHKRLNF